MEPPPTKKHSPLFIDAELGLLPGSSLDPNPDAIEISESSLAAWASGQPKRKRHQVVPDDVIELDGDSEPDCVMVIGESMQDYKNKQPIVYDKTCVTQFKDALFNDLVSSSTQNGSKHVSPLSSFKGYGSAQLDLNYQHDLVDHYAHDEDDFDLPACDDQVIENDFNINLASRFDDLDLPTGIEATVPWLKNAEIEASRKTKKELVLEDKIIEKYRSFKQFDCVCDSSDHYFSKPGLFRTTPCVKKPSKDWTTRIQYEWKILEKDLPETIFVRIYEERMDILRAVIIGPTGTPYHDGLFFFDIYFPSSYPHVPPMVHYHSGGLRINPNLYACGKVCLSLLNTWSGTGCEKWSQSNSTILQVLVSLQGLVLNAKPYFNEPGYELTAKTDFGEKESLAYNEETFLLSCKTMLYSLRKPPMYFGDFVAGHFHVRGPTILTACRAYMDGAQVGCVVGGVQDVDQGDKSCSASFKSSLMKLYEDLLMEFTVKAVCDEFLAEKVKLGTGHRGRSGTANIVPIINRVLFALGIAYLLFGLSYHFFYV